MTLIDGKAVSEKVLEDLGRKVALLKEKHGITPGLAVIIAGDDPASHVYVRSKVKQAARVGMNSFKHELAASATTAEITGLVKTLNSDSSVHGILVQSPPPPHINEREIIETVSPEKDVDCFHPVNAGRLLTGDENCFIPCTPQGVMTLLEHYGIETAGKHAVVIGRSNIVGKPMAVLLSRKAKNADCTVTLCHSRTRNIAQITSQADILVAAIGRPNFVTANMVANGAVVIDVGINRMDDPLSKKGYSLVGDVDFEAVAPKASYITPVPGGVGAITIAMLFKNTLKACCDMHGIKL